MSSVSCPLPAKLRVDDDDDDDGSHVGTTLADGQLILLGSAIKHKRTLLN